MGEIIEKIREFFTGVFQRLFKKGSGSVLGVDIGASSIKVVQLRRKHGKAILETYGELALGPYADFAIGQATNLSADKLVEALNDVIREANVTTKNAGVSIPLAASLLSVIEIPFISKKRLEELIPIEARKYIPVPITDVSLDWWLLPSTGPLSDEEEKQTKKTGQVNSSLSKHRKTVKVLIVAIHNTILDKYRRIIGQTNLDVSFFEIEIFSFIRALLSGTRTAALVLDLGSSTTKLSIVENGIPFSTHIINRGSQDITIALSKSLGLSMPKAEELKRAKGLSKGAVADEEVENTTRLIIGGIFSSANRMLLDYEKKYNKTVEKVILLGSGSRLKGIFEIARSNFDAEVIFADPFSRVETPAFLEPVLKEAGPSFTVAIGIALRKLEEME